MRKAQIVSDLSSRSVNAVTKVNSGKSEVCIDVADELNCQQKRVLLVEDDIVIRMATAEMLSDLGYQVVEAGSVEEASAAMRTESLQVLLTDLVLQDGNGMDLVKDVSETQPDMAVIIASGADLREHIEGSDLGRPVTGLAKPYDQHMLQRALEQCIEGR